MKVKKALMTTLWRVQQAQTVISIAFWSLTLAGIFHPYVADKWLDEAIGPNNIALGMLLIVALVMVAVIVFGYVYDRLKFWREQQDVIQERNPYTFGAKVQPTQIILWDAVINRTPASIELAKRLIDHAMDDPIIEAAFIRIEEEVGD